MPAATDREFARLVLSRKLASQAAVDECLEGLAAFEDNAVPKAVAELLVDKGHLRAGDAVELLKELKQDVLECSKCGARYKLKPKLFGTRPKCPKCSGTVLLAGTPSSDAPDRASGQPKTVVVAEPSDPLIGTTLDRYKILEKLGEGGMGAVYKAENLDLGRIVALKLLPPETTSRKPEHVERFLQEARTAAQLIHPNAVIIHSIGQEGQQHFIEMEFVDGQNLEQIVRSRGPIPVGEAIPIIIDACRALSAAHAKNIVHRDVKPGNIVVSSTGETKVTDFGLAKIVLSEGEMTSSGQVLGTPQYMAPEQWDGKTEGPATDVYSLGVTTYCLVTGKLPYRGASSPMEILSRVIRRDLLPIKEANPDLPDSLCRVIEKMMAPEAESRYEDCDALRADLEQVDTGGPPPGLMEGAVSGAAGTSAPSHAGHARSEPSASPVAHELEDADARTWVEGLTEIWRKTSAKRRLALASTFVVIVALGVVWLAGPRTEGSGPGVKSEPRASEDSGAGEHADTAETLAAPPKHDVVAGDPSITISSEDMLPPGLEKAFMSPTEKRDQYGNLVVTRNGNKVDPETGYPYEIWLKEPRMELVWIPAVKCWVGKYEVTNGQYRRCDPNHDSRQYKGHDLNGDCQPVVQISYDEAVAFGEWLTRRAEAASGPSRHGWQYRLPSAAEWSALAECGDRRKYPWGSEWPPKYGNYSDQSSAWPQKIDGYDDGFPVTCVVGESGRNDWGLYGVGGNVWEWTPEFKQKDRCRYLRGGSWADCSFTAGFLRCQARYLFGRPSTPFNCGGLRVLLSPKQGPPTRSDREGETASKTYINPTDGSIMVLVSQDTFRMGSDTGPDGEKPAHEVDVSAFYIAKHEVTNRQFKAFVDANPQWRKDRIDPRYHDGDYLKDWGRNSYPRGKADHPIVYVSWFAAKAYCEWAEGRLPTEAEWECACRAGSTAKYCFGDRDTQLGDYAWYGENSGGSTHPVGAGKPNPWGFQDMHGNVYEWCSSMYQPYPYKAGDGREGVSDSASSRVLRGGSWHSNEHCCRSASRTYSKPINSCRYNGFRLCVSARAPGAASLPTRPQPRLKGKLPPALEKAFMLPIDDKDQYGNPVVTRLSAAPGAAQAGDGSKVDPDTGWPYEIWLKEPRMEFVFVPAGEFMLGSARSAREVGRTYGGQPEYLAQEHPRHRVRISRAFYLAKYETTQEQWRSVMGSSPWSGRGCVKNEGRCPAVHITWEDSQRFLKKLGQGAGGGFRLPTEAEWEYACRAGSGAAYSFGDSIDGLRDYAWYRGNVWEAGERYAHAVGTKRPNAWGLYDMHGNVWDMCQDWYGPYASGTQIDPRGPTLGSGRVCRGGSFNILHSECRTAFRMSYPPDRQHDAFGARVALSLPAAHPAVGVPTAGTAQAKTYVNPTDGSTMVPVPGGTFRMGSDTGEDNEKPAHEVFVAAYHIAKHEVTNKQFKKFVDANPEWRRNRIDPRYHDGKYLKHWEGSSYPGGKADHPVAYVSWFAAKAYCEWASGRLPTEAEWEKACRAGSTTQYCFGDDETKVGDYAWHRSNSGGRPRAVGQRKPNAWGIHDMHGNVWEWTSSLYRPYPYRADDGREDLSNSSSRRVLRAGGCTRDASYCRSANRCSGSTPRYCFGNDGFRLCASARAPRATSPATRPRPRVKGKLPSALGKAFMLPTDDKDQYGNPVATRHGKEVDPETGWSYEIWLNLPAAPNAAQAGEPRMEFVLVPAGEFLMGSAAKPEALAQRYGGKAEHYEGECPQHRVKITKPFYLGKYEITQAQWEQVMRGKAWSGKDYVQESPRHAAAYISWDDCQAFLRKVNGTAAGASLGLPTEAQWERACRAGTATEFFFGDGEAMLKEYAWYDDTADDIGEKYTHGVGLKRPNGLGLYDMCGNVWEWCQNWYGPYSSGAQTDPRGPNSGSGRVSRGGGFSSPGRFCRSSQRVGQVPGFRYRCLGFRVVACVSEAAEKPAPAQTTPRKPTARKAVPLDRLEDGVVYITTVDAATGAPGFGTGFVVDSSGLIATCYHVVATAAKAQAQFRDGAKLPIQGCRAFDKDSDLAILQLSGTPPKLAPLTLGPDTPPQQGSAVIAIGHPQGFKHTVSRGTVNAVRKTSELPAQTRAFVQTPDETVWIQTDAVIAAGSSGGPVMNENGEVIGISAWTVGEQNLGFAVHVHHLVALKREASEAKEVKPLPLEGGPGENPLAQLDDRVNAVLTEYQRAREDFIALVEQTIPRERQKLLTTKHPGPPYRKKFLGLARALRKTRAAYQALVITCQISDDASPDARASLDAATKQLLEDHLEERTLVQLVAQLVQSPHEPYREFLRKLMDQSPLRDCRAVACFCLALNLNAMPTEGEGVQDHIVSLLERVVNEFGDVVVSNVELKKTADPLLFECKHLMVGKTAPDIVGKDINGTEFRLSDYHGKVVVLDFFADWCPYCSQMYPRERVLRSRLRGKPFVLLGVNSDTKEVFQHAIDQKKVTWRCWWDGPEGPIATRWNVQTIPTVYVLDTKGVIRYKFIGTPDNDLEKGVFGLMEELRGLKLTNVRVTGGPHSPGDVVTIEYQLTNTTDEEVEVPSGTRQHWIERLGPDPIIAGKSKKSMRWGRKYAAGGLGIKPATLAPGESVQLQQRVGTKGYPVGKYRFYIQYKVQTQVLMASVTVHTESVTFELVAGKAGQSQSRTSHDKLPQALANELKGAAIRGDAAKVKALLETNAELVNTKDRGYRSTPLHYAAYTGREAAVEVLLDAGADANAQNRYGVTPLHDAAARGHQGIVALLLTHQADVSAKDKRGRTPLICATNGGHKTVADLLRQHGAK